MQVLGFDTQRVIRSLDSEVWIQKLGSRLYPVIQKFGFRSLDIFVLGPCFFLTSKQTGNHYKAEAS